MSCKIHERPVLSSSLFFAACVLLSFLCVGLQIGQSAEKRYLVYSVRFEYFGVDATEMEKTITIPLEEHLSILEGLIELVSTCEYGKSYTTAYFSKSMNAKNTYLALRDVVDTLYNTLPQAVQKPRIYSSAADQKAVISIAASSDTLEIDAVRAHIEKSIKEKIEAAAGVSEVIVAGGHIQEIKVEFDTERLASGGIDPNALGNVVRDANVLSPSGKIRGGFSDTNIVFNTRLSNLAEIAALPVVITEGVVTQLSHLAAIEKKPRAQEEIVRINGKESIVISVKAASGGNSIAISKACSALFVSNEIAYQVLYDDGAFILSLIKKLCFAILQSFLLVALIIPFFFKAKRTLLLIFILLPASILWTTALLSAMGFSLDNNALSGISIALGLIVDPALVLAELAEKNRSRSLFIAASSSVLRSIIASAFTTLLALAPLFFLEYIVPGIRTVAVTIACMIVSSLVISALFLPCFMYKNAPAPELVPSRIFFRLQRACIRVSYRMSALGVKNRRATRIVYGTLIFVPFVVFALAGKNISLEARDEVLPAYIEFESEKSPAAVEKNSTQILGLMREIHGVRFVSSEARKGAMEISVGFSPKETSREILAAQINALSAYSTDGFLYVPDSAATKKSRVLPVEIAVIGDDSNVCRELAREAASLVGTLRETEQVVLNFKNPEEIIRFVPDKDLIEKSGVSVGSIAHTMRWILFGPVIDKWIEDGRETDIRVSGNSLDDNTLDRVANLYIPTPRGGVRLEALGTLQKAAGTGKIYRKDGRRAAYFTTHINSKSADKTIAVLRRTLSSLPLPRGYGFSFSRELEDMNAQYGVLLAAFIASIASILILLIGTTENVRTSLLITAIIPVSASLPLLLKFVAGSALTMGDVVGMVVLGGIGVNNAIYIAESTASRVRFRVREKVQSLWVTSLTTIAGALPLLVFADSEFSKSLAFFMLWGMISSAAGSMILFPAVLGQNRTKNTV